MNATPFVSQFSLFCVEDIRKIELAANSALPAGSLMRAAGAAAADFARTLIQKPNKRVLILAGPGNNGGDAIELAHQLAIAGYPVSLMLCAGSTRYSEDALQSLRRAQAAPIELLGDKFLSEASIQECALVVDGIFGIGLRSPISGELAALITQLNALTQKFSTPVLALDVPSGLDADCGQVHSETNQPGVAVRASHTITFIANKPGLHTAAGKDYAGEVEMADLGIGRKLFPEPCGYLSHAQIFREISASLRRRHNSHKGSFGELWIIGGAAGMLGAPVLAARAALHCGAGRVNIGFIAPTPVFDSGQPELMYKQATDLKLKQQVLVIGPGLGQSSAAQGYLALALEAAPALVIDADAINLIAADPTLQKVLAARASRKMSTILTPHPLEAARLLRVTCAQVQADRWHLAQALARTFQACVILKGSGTVIASPDTPFLINTSGNPALATAGTGDVLAGICGAMLAQNLGPANAAGLAVWLHGLAADTLVKQGIGPVGLTAGEFIPAVRLCLNQIIKEA